MQFADTCPSFVAGGPAAHFDVDGDDKPEDLLTPEQLVLYMRRKH